ncbi:arsenate reductase (azurin) small subunit [Vibrio splendidus]
MIANSERNSSKRHNKCMMSRRDFLLYSGAATAVSIVPLTLFSGTDSETQVEGRIVGYPRKKIAKLSQLINHIPVHFQYPDEEKNSIAMLVKSDIECGGGIGLQRDIVAYSMTCTHQGGPLTGAYKATGEHRIVGQCPFHLSTFDLRRHGIMVSGQAFESLPQVLLELEGDDIYAVGVMGLIFGRMENLIDVEVD